MHPIAADTGTGTCVCSLYQITARVALEVLYEITGADDLWDAHV